MDLLIRKLRSFGRRVLPLVTISVAAVLMTLLIPVSDTLWAKILYISGVVHTLPGKGEGCTPGFWKQEHHFSSWPEPYSADLKFTSAFGRDVPEDPTLLEALWSKGGGLEALERHATAALLNATSLHVDYAFEQGEVIVMFQEAFDSGDPDQIEATKDEFDAANESHCPLPVKDEKKVESEKIPAAAIATDTPTATATETPEATVTNTSTPTPTYTHTATATDTTMP